MCLLVYVYTVYGMHRMSYDGINKKVFDISNFEEVEILSNMTIQNVFIYRCFKEDKWS